MTDLNNILAAQKELVSAGNELVSIGLRLQGTEYEKDVDALKKKMNTLNHKLIREIKKRRKK